MSLNKQLLLVSLLLLSLPWAGYQYLVDMSESLRERQVSILENNSQLIARAISQSPLLQTNIEAKSNLQQPIYCHHARRPIRVDGYVVDYEWTNRLGDPLPWSTFNSDHGARVMYRCSRYNDLLQLMFEVRDTNVVFRNPGQASPLNGDRLILQTGLGVNYVFATAAAGSLNPISVDANGFRPINDIVATWVDQPQGYQIELVLPSYLVGEQMSFIVVDQQTEDINNSIAFGPGLNIPSRQLPNYLSASAELQQLITPFAHNGLRVKLLSPEGWLLASAGELQHSEAKQQVHWLLKAFYQRLLKQADVGIADFKGEVNLSQRKEVAALSAPELIQASHWYSPQYQDPDRIINATEFILASATEIQTEDKQKAGVLVLEQSSEQTSSLTDQAFNRFFLTSAATLVIVILVLMGYASWLSWRIRKLSIATRNAIESKTTLGEHFPTSIADDEIGKLSRDFSALTYRIDEYTVYLRDLSQKLSHELRTPLAIIHSSLDNLESQALDQQSQTYQQRAKEGASRLGQIITAMSEARRVEESLEHAEPETVNIVQLLQDLTSAYQDIYSPQQVRLIGITTETPPLNITAYPDLLVQMMDKLMDNAHSFCPEDGQINIEFHADSDHYTISISNDGPLLPEHMQDQLFDNLVSIRPKGSERHLGMGLQIVRLIVDHHQGAVSAQNRGDNSGVVFITKLPINRAAY